MNRKDFNSYAKKYGIAVMVSIPFMIVASIFLIRTVSNAWLVVINCGILLVCFTFTLLIAEAWKNHITRKRTEYLYKKEKEEKSKLQIIPVEEEEPKNTKIIQKQKKPYKTVKSKK